MVHLGDITKMSGYTIPPVDVITFGSPCQDLSIAGKRAGMAGERSGLFSEAVRIIREMRYATFGAYPKYAVWENVPGAFSSNKGEDFHAVLQSLCRVIDPDATIPRPTDARGGIKWPRAGAILADHYSLAWRTMDAQHWGVPQRRLRISLVLDLTGGRAGEILFEPESLRGHFAPGITPGQGAAGAVENGAGTADCTDAIPVNLQIATRHKSLGERTGLGIGRAGDAAYTLQEGHEHGVCYLDDAKAYTLKIRSGCEGGGKGALVQTEKSATLSTLQDQTLFVAELPNYDGSTNITSNPTKTFSHSRVVVGRAQAWTERDFSYDITGGEDTLADVASQIGEYWEEVDQATIIKILTGIFAMKDAEGVKFVREHTYDVTGKTNSEGALGLMDGTSLNTAMQRACGDNKGAFSLAIMHSAVATGLENLKLLAYMKYTDKDGIERELQIGTLNGRTVLVHRGLSITEVYNGTENRQRP